jgi:hypothetical protein
LAPCPDTIRRYLPTILITLVSACGGSPTGDEGDGSDFEGFWQLTVDVTTTSGVCDGEELEPVEVINALITQEGSVVTATAEWSSESGSVSLTGGRAGNEITFSGSYDEDGGTTVTAYTLTIGTNSLNGTEAWSWIGPGGSCPTGGSTVTGAPL